MTTMSAFSIWYAYDIMLISIMCVYEHATSKVQRSANSESVNF